MSTHRRFMLDPGCFCADRLRSGDRARRPLRAAGHRGTVEAQGRGDRVTLLDGSGTEYDAVIDHVDRTQVEAVVRDTRVCECEPLLHLVVAVCVPKGDRMDLIVQKCTELGAAEIVPLTSKRSLVTLDPARASSRLARWKRIACEAVEQSGRARCPIISEVASLESFLAGSLRCELVLLAWEKEEQISLMETLHKLAAQSVMLIVGPEGGFDEEEIEMAKAAGAKCVTLGRRRLRTETAAIAATAAIMLTLDRRLA